MPLVDSHCHLNFPDFDGRIDAILQNAAEHDVERILCIATSWENRADVLALASIEVDLSQVEEGQRITVTWRGKPVFIDNRTAEQIDAARDVDMGTLPDPQSDAERVKEGRDNWLVIVGVCTHLGCTVPWIAEEGRFLCPCHSSAFDIRGDVVNPPAPRALDLYAVRIENRIVKVDVGAPIRRSTFESEQATRA